MKKRFTRLLVLILALATTIALLPLTGNHAQAAFRADVPENMRDNYVLNALRYAGYDVDKLIADGHLYNSGYIDDQLLLQEPDVLSDIGYWRSSNGYSLPNGDNTVADTSTPTGRAPNIAVFEQRGMVCASFVTYYLCNYLPNIEGVDTSYLYERAKEIAASGNFYYLTTVNIWEQILSTLSKEAGSGVTRYTDKETAYKEMDPGDVIVFENENGLNHVGIYAGEYYLYNMNGNKLTDSTDNDKIWHFIAHVSSDRGPEISTVEYQERPGNDKPGSTPVAFYHIDWPVQTGSIEVNKKDPSGKVLSGAEFLLTNTSTGENLTLGPTNSNGYAFEDEVPFGTYTVKETKAPEGYELSTQTWTVTLDGDTPNGTITINAVNQPLKGNLIIQKHTNTGKDLYGWKFQVKNSSGTVVATVTTDDTGYAIVEDLTPGNYTVEEIGGPDGAWNSQDWAFDVESTGGVVVYTGNMFQDPLFSEGKTNWGGTNGTTITATTFDGRTALKIDASTGTSSSGYVYQSGLQNVAPGTYTLSGWIYLEQAQNVILSVWTNDSGSWATVRNRGLSCEAGWNYVSYTFELPQDYDNLIAGYGISSTMGAGYLWQPRFAAA